MTNINENNIYCGINTLKNNVIYGTPQECYNSGQVRRYGLIKINPKELDKFNNNKKKISKTKIIKNMSKYNAEYKKINNLIDKLNKHYDKNCNEINKLKNKLEIIKKKRKKYNELFNSINK
jgi:predicted RNase H-like nuclease (RuvC/YqgF family)